MEGQVVNARTGAPLRNASITASRQSDGPEAAGVRSNYSATTDASGRFSIAGLEPGTYRVSADLTGYVKMQYNARSPGGLGTAFDLGRAQKMTGVDFRLPPHGAITGKVTDEDGDPLQGVQIEVMRLGMYSQGRKELIFGGHATTNDLGEYRAHGIVPGKYYLCAIYRGRPMSVGKASGQEDYAPTFFPNATDFAVASTIDLAPGDQMGSVNFRLTKIHTVRVSGHVLDNSAPPPSTTPVDRPASQSSNGNRPIRLRLLRRNVETDSLGIDTPVRADGAFEFPSVPPGSYCLVATAGLQGRVGPHAVMQSIDVGNHDLEGVHLTIPAGVEVTGHVRYDRDPPHPLPSLAVRLTGDAALEGSFPRPANVDDGNFQIHDLTPNIYTVYVDGYPRSLYLKAVTAGNRDAMVSGIDLLNGSANVEIVLGVNPPQVSVSVVNAETGKPASGVMVVLIPREKERQGKGYFYPSNNTDQYGNFTFSGLIPGEYSAYAWEDAPYNQWFDPDWLKAYEGKGEKLSAKKGSPVSVKLTMIPAN
jgi:hypothetical protein